MTIDGVAGGRCQYPRRLLVVEGEEGGREEGEGVEREGGGGGGKCG